MPFWKMKKREIENRAKRIALSSKKIKKINVKNERIINMLYKAQTLIGYTLRGIDGEFGTVKEFYFDDQHWTIRYLIAETGTWLTDRQVLISPYALTGVEKAERRINVNLTKKQIESSPAISNDKPVSQQFEDDFYRHYGWAPYYGGSFMWGAYPYILPDRGESQELDQHKRAWDPCLRSTKVVSEYYIQATDGEIGHVADFLIDDEAWAIRYMVVDTKNWWPGKEVLVSPQWIDRISWDEAKVFVKLSLDAIKQSPEYTDDLPLTRAYEAKLHEHYNQSGYWAEVQAARRIQGDNSMTIKTGLAKSLGQESPDSNK